MESRPYEFLLQDEVFGLESASILEPVDGEVGWLAPQNNRFIWAWMLDSGSEMMGVGEGEAGRWGNKVKRLFNSREHLLERQASGRGMC